MPIDHAARAAQVGRIIGHVTPGSMLWVSPDTARRVSFAFSLTEDKRDGLDVARDDSDENTVRLIVAAAAFASEFPRVGQSFTATDGRLYRIQKILSPPYAPTAAFRCSVTSP